MISSVSAKTTINIHNDIDDDITLQVECRDSHTGARVFNSDAFTLAEAGYDKMITIDRNKEMMCSFFQEIGGGVRINPLLDFADSSNKNNYVDVAFTRKAATDGVINQYLCQHKSGVVCSNY